MAPLITAWVSPGMDVGGEVIRLGLESTLISGPPCDIGEEFVGVEGAVAVQA